VAAKIFLALDSRVLRESLASLLRNNGKGCVQVCGVSACTIDTNELVDAISASGPDVIVTETKPAVPLRNGYLRRILSFSTGARILMVDMKGDDQSFLDAVRCGATGFLLRDCSAADVLTAVRSLARGEPFCPPNLCQKLLQYVAEERFCGPSVEVRVQLGLTRRQQEIAPLLADGLTNKEIASRLNLSEQTVKNHVHSMLRRTGAKDRFAVADQARTVLSQARYAPF
jgi:two-component system, NarL family, response regulator DegU